MMLQIYRETLTPGDEPIYEAIESETARRCVELQCPHPHLALQSLETPHEVWWINEFDSDADRQRVERAYAANTPLMAALEHSSQQKAKVTAPPVNVYAYARPAASGRHDWTLAGARFVVVTVTRAEVTPGFVFEAEDGTRYVLLPVRTRQEADAAVRDSSSPNETRLFAVRPDWGLPAPEWVRADPDFWRTHPLLSKR
jgi:hypothetical protein